jgi:hypothetical protein
VCTPSNKNDLFVVLFHDTSYSFILPSWKRERGRKQWKQKKEKCAAIQRFDDPGRLHSLKGLRVFQMDRGMERRRKKEKEGEMYNSSQNTRFYQHTLPQLLFLVPFSLCCSRWFFHTFTFTKKSMFHPNPHTPLSLFIPHPPSPSPFLPINFSIVFSFSHTHCLSFAIIGCSKNGNPCKCCIPVDACLISWKTMNA